ncbi:DUF2536 family protein [Paenibacillus nasutitermitis]|uniref:DUF2536 family protein n=1 Tax=Paenibacillus nasutitermitis TaxID=1652958 RepID=A0A916YNE4_9BACL|nr:DUF2536 family protein [Paenibacillus nasutitermitis]GGD53644.1 hypothetical protein GCM10010911_09000 [Paenibacillus nasutitermitis]
MEISLSRIENKIEFFEAQDLRTLEAKINDQIENNKALMLDVFTLSHQAVFNPMTHKMQYSAVVHFKAK